MKFLILLSFLISLNAAIIRVGTVCTPSCDTASFATALTTVARGDIIELTAGETFEGAFTLPYLAGSDKIKVRSSRWAELPRIGNRVVAADASLMPKLMATNTSSPIITAGYGERIGSSVNTTTEVITFSTTLNISDGDPFVCRISIGGTGPLTPYVIYYARDVSGATMKVAAEPGGGAINLTTAISGTFTCTNNKAIRGWEFDGIEFAGKAGSPSVNALVHISSDANTREAITTDIHIRRSYIRGIRDEDGAKNCLVLNARSFSVTDSRLEFCKLIGVESHAISMTQTPGPGLIKNNYLDGASENILSGGAFISVLDLINGDEGPIEITGNYLYKPIYLKYRAGTGQSGAPVGACTDFTYNIDSDTGLVYQCIVNVWVASPTCADDEYYRQSNVTQSCVGGACWKCSSGVYVADTIFRSGSYFVKNHYENKHGKNVHFYGNVMENMWSNNGDQTTGISVWVESQINNGNGDGWVRGERLYFHDNLIKNSEAGIRVATNGAVTYGIANNKIHVKNNLGLLVGLTAYPTIPDRGSSVQGSGLEVGGRCEDCSWDHNTMYNATNTSGRAVLFDTSPVTRLFFGNNITARNTNGVRGNSGSECSGITNVVGADDLLTNNAFFDNRSLGGLGNIGSCATNTNYVAGSAATHFTSTSDARLLSTSPYSAKNGSPVFIGTDSKDLGADIDSVEAYTGSTIAGTPSLQESIKIIPGSTRALIKYTAPSGSACNLKLYDNIGRVTLHADTADSAKWVDTRTGNITIGTSRQFVLGTISALTASTKYWGVISCGSTLGVVEFNTTAAGSTSTAVSRYGSAVAGRYSTDLTTWTAISLSTTHSIPVSGVTYYQSLSGPIKVLIAKN